MIFSGTGRLSQHVEACGVPVLEPLDYLNGSHCHLRRRSTQSLVLQWIEKGLIGFVHLGTPCTIWSRARHGVKDSPSTRIREETGVELALFSTQVIRTCIKFGVYYALENPGTSKLFQFEPIVTAVANGPRYEINLDMCQFGEPYKKPTKIITSAHWLLPLGKRCNHTSHEGWLKGRVKVLDSSGRAVYVNRTALAGAYPFKLVEQYARLIKHFGSLGTRDDQVVQVAWGAALRSAQNRKAQGHRVSKSKGVTWGPDQQQYPTPALRSRGTWAGNPKKRGRACGKGSSFDDRYREVLKRIRPERLLRVKRIQARTLLLYDDHVQHFLQWVKHRKANLKSESLIDKWMSIFFHALFDMKTVLHRILHPTPSSDGLHCGWFLQNPSGICCLYHGRH